MTDIITQINRGLTLNRYPQSIKLNRPALSVETDQIDVRVSVLNNSIVISRTEAHEIADWIKKNIPGRNGMPHFDDTADNGAGCDEKREEHCGKNKLDLPVESNRN